MSERAAAFVRAWIASNISADGFRTGDRRRAEHDLEMLKISAFQVGILPEEIIAEFPDLETFIASAQAAAEDKT
ncbi:hypothetical protein ABLE91_28550 [Aquabacter sp. CN5-332]|uniref:hypothetical protein n=1 Tax=Aquabacter sp. CN5-332 TaxID=3156608 RepID=UPI0032B43978